MDPLDGAHWAAAGLRCRFSYKNPIELTADDLALISSLPALETLSIPQPGCVYDHEWAACLAQLRAAFAAKGRTPPAVKDSSADYW